MRARAPAEGRHAQVPPAGVAAHAVDAGPRSDGTARCYLSFDFGTRRIGVASGNSVTCTAAPLTTLCGEGEARFRDIEVLLAQWKPDALVVGVPRHPDGAPHDNTRRAERFARQLHGRFHLPVHTVDERYTTTEARSLEADDKRIDAVAAALILDQFLRDHR
jgi:putative Holliday junction resolvase